MKNRGITMTPYLFLIPSFILLVVFCYYPIIYSLVMSFTDYKFGRGSHFIGFANYLKLPSDPVFVHGLKVQGIMVAMDVFNNTFFPLLAAELLYFVASARWEKTFRTLFIIPFLVPGMVIIMLWTYIYDPNMGALNNFLALVGLGDWQMAWLAEEKTAIWAILEIGFPFISGLIFLIFYAGIGTINSELKDAASMDGATGTQLVRYIHLPLMRTYIAASVILTVIGSLQNYPKILVSSGGGPGFQTYIPALEMYDQAFRSQDIGYACTIGVVLLILITLLTLASSRISRNGGGE